jgi:hypothetical protein
MTGVGNARGRGMVRVFVDSGLQLLQELIDVQEIALSPQVGKWQRVRVVHRRMLRLSNHCAAAVATTILGHAAALVTAASTTEDGKLDTLQTHEPLAYVIVGGRVDCTTLGVSKELVERIIRGAFPNLVVVVELLRLVDGIVNRTIGRVLWWASVEASWSTTWVLLAIASIGTKRAIGILISTRCSGKRLQVSDH